jgi:hypothetical protein
MGISFRPFFEKLLDKLIFLHYVNVPWMVLHLIYYFGADWKSDKKIFKVSANQNTLLALAAMLDF